MTNFEEVNQSQKKKGTNPWIIIIAVIGGLILLYVIGAWLMQGLGGSSTAFAPSSAELSSSKSSSLKTTEVSSELSTESTSSDDNSENTERLIIKDAKLSIVVSDVEDSAKKISQYAENQDGYVASSEINNPLDQPRSYITIRVPTNVLDESLDYIKNLADKIVLENISAEDITDQYTDLKSKLENYEVSEKQLQEIMKQAQNVKEVLTIQKELTNVREKIELIKGKMQYLGQNVEMTKISVTLALDESSLPVVSEKWRPWSQIKLAFRALLSVLRWLSYVIIWIVIFGIIWLPIWLIIKWRKKIKSQNKNTN